MTIEKPQFNLRSGSNTFRDRQQIIFNVLAAEERHVNLPSNESVEVDGRSSARRIRKMTKVLRGQESLFKVPDSPPRRRRMPDYQRNPQRWTKYSLADVPASDLTDASNTAAALSFLRSVRRSPNPPTENSLRFCSRRRRSQQSEENEDDDDTITITPAATTSAGFGDNTTAVITTAPAEQPTYQNGKLVMPEYVIGEKVKKNVAKRGKPNVGKQLTLSHLYDDDE